MRFKGFMLDAIKRSEKTVTRRLVRPGQSECPYKVGRIYAATNRPNYLAAGTKSNAKGGWESLPISIVSIRKERLCDITTDEALKEGFASYDVTARDRFLLVWGMLHGYDSENPNPEVWRIEFKRVPESWTK